jgi:hypothetical protein
MAPPDSESNASEHDTEDKSSSSHAGVTSSKASPEEIARQHAEALKIIEHKIPYAEPTTHGEIPLAIKRCKDAPSWSSRGHCDVSEIQSLVQIGYNRSYDENTPPSDDTANENNLVNYWCPKRAASKNVAIRRPSHDAWGIPKIVLLFCDDFCKTCYELPYYENFASSVAPILKTLNITKERIVRMILASLPPGITIPVHQDSGEWVKCTHRIHVPILVHNVDKILFTVARKHAIQCTPGHVFEINNATDHAVSNCDTDHRVHLILDYVEQPVSHIRLEPGEILLQTRRSIDREILKGTRPTPSFMILGAQKAGTTFLFELIMQHPLIVKPKKLRETHCLDWRWNDACTTTEERRKWCQKFFYYQELYLHPSCMTGDSTPSYLLDSVRVIPRIKEVFPWRLSFFVLCRDPVKRIESHFAMVTSPKGTPAQLQTRGSQWRGKSIYEVILEELRVLHSCKLIPYWTIPGVTDNSNHAVNDISWKEAQFHPDVFELFSGTQEEDSAWEFYLRNHVPLNTGSYGLLSRGLYELNLRPWLREFHPDQFLIFRFETLTESSSSISAALQQVWKHLDVPSLEHIEDTTPKNSRDYQPMLTDDAKMFLQRFYKPHNECLRNVLLQQQKQGPLFEECFSQHWSEETWKY